MDGSKGSGDASFATALAELPLLPLPGTVFFPNTLLPLHVFEPRYLRMIEAVLSDGGLLGVVLMRDGGGALHGVAGLGRVLHYEQLQDGRYHILLQGVARAQLLEELPAQGRPYRCARAQLLPDEVGDPVAVADELQALKACYHQLLDSCPESRAALGDLCSHIQEPGMLADIICASVLEEPTTRQGALEDASVLGRLKRASAALADALLRKMRSGGCVH